MTEVLEQLDDRNPSCYLHLKGAVGAAPASPRVLAHMMGTKICQMLHTLATQTHKLPKLTIRARNMEKQEVAPLIVHVLPYEDGTGERLLHNSGLPSLSSRPSKHPHLEHNAERNQCSGLKRRKSAIWRVRCRSSDSHGSISWKCAREYSGRGPRLSTAGVALKAPACYLTRLTGTSTPETETKSRRP
ncbi:unnamed protein product [Pleuronectes platessa]|uniref:Uncharacterized protein n=1 Tax=Pleuronectes platessa TaxID=8262 RepID=A0A9N7TZ81_PLEPL|nr:unnamed protein product [Pleuronectes platessa]